VVKLDERGTRDIGGVLKSRKYPRKSYHSKERGGEAQVEREYLDIPKLG